MESWAGIAEIAVTNVPDSYKGIKRIDGKKTRKHAESAERRGLSEEKLCVFMGTNRIGSEVAQCVNRAKPKFTGSDGGLRFCRQREIDVNQ